MTANCQFRISANRRRKGDGILLTARHSFLRLAYIFATLAPYVRVGGCLNCSATETRGVQRTLRVREANSSGRGDSQEGRDRRRSRSDLHLCAVRGGQSQVCTRRQSTVRRPHADILPCPQGHPQKIPAIPCNSRMDIVQYPYQNLPVKEKIP